MKTPRRPAAMDLTVHYTTPQVSYHVTEGIKRVVEERVVLWPHLAGTPVGEMAAGRIAPRGVTVEYNCSLSSYRVEFNNQFLDRCTEWFTSALNRFEPTTITGLTTKPIVVPPCTREFSYGCEARKLLLWGYDGTFREL